MIFILHQKTVQVAERSYHVLSISQPLMSTVSIFNSFLAMNAWMTSQLNVALNRKLRVSLIRLAYSLT